MPGQAHAKDKDSLLSKWYAETAKESREPRVSDAEIERILRRALAQGGCEVRKAVDQVLKLRADLRLQQVWNWVRRLRKRTPVRNMARPVWTDEMDAILTKGYQEGGARLQAAIAEIVRRQPGWPRHWLWKRAAALGLTRKRRQGQRPWCDHEISRLIDLAGAEPAASIAKALERTEASVRGKLRELGYPSRFDAAYSMRHLARVFRVSRHTVRKWLDKKWLTTYFGRISEKSLRTFCRDHADEIDFDSLDRDTQEWLVLELGYELRRGGGLD
jgi:hypothetical protein